MLKRFISYYRPHRRLFILDMLASLAVSLVGILYPIITRLMLNDLIPEKRYRTIILCGAGLLLLYIVRMLLNYFIQFYGHSDTVIKHLNHNVIPGIFKCDRDLALPSLLLNTMIECIFHQRL